MCTSGKILEELVHKLADPLTRTKRSPHDEGPLLVSPWAVHVHPNGQHRSETENGNHLDDMVGGRPEDQTR